jgi:XRCC4 N-terminal domain
MSTITLSKVQLEQGTHYLYAGWKAERFELALSDGAHVWRGVAERDHCQRLAGAGMSARQFVDESRRALCHQDLTHDRYTYRFEAERNKARKLVWHIGLDPNHSSSSSSSSSSNKKGKNDDSDYHDHDGNGSNSLGIGRIELAGWVNLRLSQGPAPHIRRIFDYLLGEKSRLAVERDESLASQRKVSEQLATLLVQDEERAELKRAFEREMYSVFAKTLNAKKGKIVALQKELDEARKANAKLERRVNKLAKNNERVHKHYKKAKEQVQLLRSKRPSAKRAQQQTQVSDDDSSDDDGDDNDDSSQSMSRKRPQRPSPTRDGNDSPVRSDDASGKEESESTMHRRHSSLSLGDLTNLGDDSQESVPLRKRRRRTKKPALVNVLGSPPSGDVTAILDSAPLLDDSSVVPLPRSSLRSSSSRSRNANNDEEDDNEDFEPPSPSVTGNDLLEFL